MNKEVLNKFVTEMLKLLQDAKAFAASELPELFKEIVAYGVWSSGIHSALALALTAAGALSISKATKLDSYANMDAQFAFGIGGMTATIVGAGLFFCEIGDFIMALVAPRLYLIEYFKEMM